MDIKLSLKYSIAFMALTFVMHEAHEIVHTTVGRIICGCWGQRDFNVWGLCDGCIEKHPIALASTFAGPIFTFIMIWIGTSMLKVSNNNSKKAFGFSLIFANMPFARLVLNPALGGGDEIYGLNQILHNHSLSTIIGVIILTAILAFPLYKAFKTINNKRIAYFLLFLLAPILIDLLMVLGVMNGLLTNGILNDYWILGSPILVTIWTIAVSLIFIFTRKNIYKLAE